VPSSLTAPLVLASNKPFNLLNILRAVSRIRLDMLAAPCMLVAKKKRKCLDSPGQLVSADSRSNLPDGRGHYNRRDGILWEWTRGCSW
jgi:hypothetical protein